MLDINSSIFSIEDYEIKVYPNPVKEILFIEIANHSELIQIEIQNALGQTMEVSQMTKNQDFYQLDLEDFSVGLYFVKLKIGENHKVVKFLKM